MNLSKILATIIMGLIYASCTPSEHLNNIKVELFDSGHSLTFSSFLEGYKIISLSSDTSEAIVHYPDRLLFFDNRFSSWIEEEIKSSCMIGMGNSSNPQQKWRDEDTMNIFG